MRRTRTQATLTEAWSSWIAEMGEWHVFGALTYDPGRRPLSRRWHEPVAPTPDLVFRHARQWLKESGRRQGHRISAAVVALEHHKSGWPHLHPLVRMRDGLQGAEFKTMGLTWFERHGYAQLQEPRNQADVAAYACKYLVKDLATGDVLLWPQKGPLNESQPARPGHVGSK